jgi:hypothetical protein
MYNLINNFKTQNIKNQKTPKFQKETSKISKKSFLIFVTKSKIFLLSYFPLEF